MSTHILVATPHPAFGELIRLSLEESSNYRVRLVQSSLDAIAAVGRVDFEIGIVDCDLRDQPTAALAGIIRQQRPDIHLIFIPPNNDPDHPSLAGVKIDGILKKPFYLPDLITMVETLINPQPMEPEPAQPVAAPVMQETMVVEVVPPVADEMPWLSDPVQASQHLTRLLLESSAHAALILQNNRIWAYAGHLDQPAAQEVTNVIARYWNWQQTVDLARFVRLDTTSTDYLVYATSMKGVYVLALVFDIAMPLTRIRTQANNLARELSTRPVEIKPFISEPAVEENIFVPKVAAPVVETAVEMAEVVPAFVEPPKPTVFIEQPVAEPPPAPIAAEITAAPVAEVEAAEEIQNLYEDDFEDEMEGPDLNLAKFLESVPPPNPVPASEVKPEPQKPLETPEFIFPWEETTSSINSHAAPTIPLRIRDFQPPQERPKSIPLPVPSDLEATRQTSRVGTPAPAERAAAQPEAEKPLTNLSQMESALPGLSHLAYTCILVPRMPNHYLNGELAEKLGIWTPQLCLAFGWRLEALSIRPSYLQWNVRVPPAVSPGALLRILRQRLSERIFAAFPKLRSQNPSGDFWAQGYLIISGSTPPSNQLVQDYIQQTRQRQGLSSH